jgi:hypothetical protein
MPGTRPGMTISFEFNNLRHGRACPGHPRPARILLIGWHSAFFRILLETVTAPRAVLDAVCDRRKRCYTIVGFLLRIVMVLTIKIKIRAIRK